MPPFPVYRRPFPYNVLTHSWTHPHLSCISRVPLSSWVDLLWAPARHALQGSKGRPTSAHHKPAGQLASCRWTSKGERGALKLVQLHSVYRKAHVYVRSPWIDKCVKYLMFTATRWSLLRQVRCPPPYLLTGGWPVCATPLDIA